MKLNRCCNTETLVTTKELYLSNVDEFTLMQCPECQQHWLYRKLETKWMDNLRFGWDEYEAWYICIAKEDLEKVYALEFEKILMHCGYVHISTMDETESKRWKAIHEKL